MSISCKTRSIYYSPEESHIEAWDKNLPDFKKEFDVKGWNSPRGGRTWTTADELNFDRWLTEVDPNIMVAWDIPVDCFDSVIALRWIYSLKEGLAFKMGGYDSYTYSSKPLLMLRKLVGAFGTKNAENLTYEVDMWSEKNYTPGVIYRYPTSSTIGHAFVFRNFDQNLGLFRTLEGPYPARVSKLTQQYFFYGYPAEVDNESPDSFRRYYSTRNNNGSVSNFINEKAHPSRRGSKLSDWWLCLELDDEPEIWESVRNYRYMIKNRDRIIFKPEFAEDPCRFQYYWQKDKTVETIPRQPAEEIAKEIIDAICHDVSERNKSVQTGFEACYDVPGFSTEDDSKCTSDASGDYSTPSRDKKILSKIVTLDGLLEYMPRRALNILQNRTCPTLSFYPPKNESRVLKALPLTRGLDDGSLLAAKWLWRFTKYYNGNGLKPYDPRKSIPERWGCRPSDVELRCLDLK